MMMCEEGEEDEVGGGRERVGRRGRRKRMIMCEEGQEDDDVGIGRGGGLCGRRERRRMTWKRERKRMMWVGEQEDDDVVKGRGGQASFPGRSHRQYFIAYSMKYGLGDMVTCDDVR